MASDVIHGVSRTLIETFVRKKLIELKDNPERGTQPDRYGAEFFQGPV